MNKTERFIVKANEIHSNKYLYTKTIVNSMDDTIIITCPIHGDFEQKAKGHIHTMNGCKKCAFENRYKKTLEERKTKFINKANEVHNNKYDYSKLDYVDIHTKVIITCPIHGDFTQLPNNHVNNKAGCPECGIGSIISLSSETNEGFIKRANIKHNNKYKYTKSKYINAHTKVIITCPIHGDFTQTPNRHIYGDGCPDCGKISVHRNKITGNKVERSHVKMEKNIEPKTCKIKKTLDTKQKEFIEKVNEVHDNKYNDSVKEELERNIRHLLEEFNINFIQRDRTILGNKLELDFFIPEHNLAIECHGNYWHSSAISKDTNWIKNHMINKLKRCNELGITLLQFYEDEILNKIEIVKNIISHRLNIFHDKIYARNTNCIIETDHKTVKEFLNKYHLQGGNTRFDVAYGLRDKHCELVAVMCFGKNISTRNKSEDDEIELIRYASKGRIVGGASKLFIKFLLDEDMSFKRIFSYSDNRFSSGGLYETLGFDLEQNVSPSYYYIKNTSVRIHKAAMTKTRLMTKFNNLEENETEEQNALKNGFYRLYDAGKKKFVFSL
jgi:hypothetical protein